WMPLTCRPSRVTASPAPASARVAAASVSAAAAGAASARPVSSVAAARPGWVRSTAGAYLRVLLWVMGGFAVWGRDRAARISAGAAAAVPEGQRGGRRKGARGAAHAPAGTSGDGRAPAALPRWTASGEGWRRRDTRGAGGFRPRSHDRQREAGVFAFARAAAGQAAAAVGGRRAGQDVAGAIGVREIGRAHV